MLIWDVCIRVMRALGRNNGEAEHAAIVGDPVFTIEISFSGTACSSPLHLGQKRIMLNFFQSDTTTRPFAQFAEWIITTSLKMLVQKRMQYVADVFSPLYTRKSIC